MAEKRSDVWLHGVWPGRADPGRLIVLPGDDNLLHALVVDIGIAFHKADVARTPILSQIVVGDASRIRRELHAV